MNQKREEEHDVNARSSQNSPLGAACKNPTQTPFKAQEGGELGRKSAARYRLSHDPRSCVWKWYGGKHLHRQDKSAPGGKCRATPVSSGWPDKGEGRPLGRRVRWMPRDHQVGWSTTEGGKGPEKRGTGKKKPRKHLDPQ